MLRKHLALGSCLAATLVVAGCADQTTAPRTAPKTRAVATSSSLRGSANGLVASAVRDLNFTGGSRVIAGDPNACNVASPINDFLDASLGNTFSKGTDEINRFFVLYDNAADQLPTYEALVYQSSSTPQFYGYTGAFTNVMEKTERDVKRFWDIPSADIQVVAMHGSVLLDVQRSAATYVSVFGVPAPIGTLLAQQNVAAMNGSQTLSDPNTYPFWTFNAVAFPGEHDEFFDIPAKIVMGDGILEGYAAVGFGDVAPQAIFAHEFAHQIQFANNYFLGNTAAGDAPLPPRVTRAERTRYDELMADAYAAYYLTHARGGTLRQKRVEEFLSVFFQIGDCLYTNGGHHGTPKQRLAAARFGFQVAADARKQGHIMTSDEFHKLFVKQYPAIIVLDIKAVTTK